MPGDLDASRDLDAPLPRQEDCRCPCHHTPGMVHVTACCDGKAWTRILENVVVEPALPFYIVHAKTNGRAGLFVVGTLYPNRAGYSIPDDAKPEDLEAIARYLRARQQQRSEG